MNKEANEAIDELIQEGKIRALCHDCRLPMQSIYDKSCYFCKCKIVLDNVIVEAVLEENLN
jgi:hypothetical protein